MFLAIFLHGNLCIMYSVFQLFVNSKSEVRYMWEMLWYFYGFLCREGLAPVLQFLCYFHIFFDKQRADPISARTHINLLRMSFPTQTPNSPEQSLSIRVW